MGASVRATIPKAAADATTNASSASPHIQRDMTASVSRTSSVPCATTTVTSRCDTRPSTERGVLDSKRLPDLKRAPYPSVRKRDVRERWSRGLGDQAAEIAVGQRRRAREHRRAVDPSLIVPRADRALEFGQGHVLELRTAGLVLRHARHRRGIVRKPVVELPQEGPSEHAVYDERERREHDD